MNLRDYLKNLLPKTKDEVGVWHQPDGEAYYAQRVKTVTTLNITPDEAYSRLEKEVKLLSNELKEVVEQKSGNKKENMSEIRSLDDLQAIVDEMDKFLDQIVSRKPRNKVQVRYTVANDTAICQYIPSNIGSQDPATIFVPRNFGTSNSYDLRWVLYHEGVPGHHLQLSLNREMENVPIFRKIIPFEAFTEGWATYAQDLPWKMGIIKDDSVRESLIRTRLFHMGRALLDIGVNYKRWSREEAIQFSLDYQICNKDDAYGLLNYCTVNPASELSYAIGCLKIEELRDKAQKTLKDRFDIREFHDKVLENGAIPLDILDKKINAYIEQ